MNIRLPQRLTAAIAGALFAAALPFGAAGEDVDIFSGTGGTATDPNVLIILDSSSNWNATLSANTCNTGNMAANTKFAAEVCALRTVLTVLPSKMRLGLMMFNESGDNGSYVRFAVRNMTPQNKQAMSDMLANWVANGTGTDNSGSNQPYGKTMFEAWKYFGGGGTTRLPQGSTGFGPISFKGGAANNAGTYRRDYTGNNSGGPSQANGNRAAEKYGADAYNAFGDSSSNTYNTPILSDCAKNFIIFIGNGNPSTGGDSSSPTADTVFTNIGGDASAAGRIKSGGTEIHPSLMDEMARYFFKQDASDRDGVQIIRTYTVAVYALTNAGTISNTDQQMINLLKSAANNGGGKYFAATQAGDIVKALLTILNEVQAVNSVFVSASLPVSVNTQGTFLNQVYMGLFRPDAAGNPRWLGNVKEFKFIQDSSTGDIYLADSLGNRAVNPATGFITPASVSFWTSASTFWANNQTGIPPSASDSPDGDVVEKGGTAEVQRQALLTGLNGQNARSLYTCPSAGCTPNTALNYAFTNGNIFGATAQTAFGVASAGELTLLIDWIRGQDNAAGATLSPLVIGQAPCDPAVAGCTWQSGETGPGWPTTVRASLHGDVLHSRPVVLNYCNDATACPGQNLSPVNGPYIFYGSNDGFLRAVKGGQAATDGTEVWSFVAPEFYGKFKRLRYQDPAWLTPNTPPALPAATKDYFFDGPIGAYEDPTTSPPTKWIFVAARRGGRVIYAFDVTDPTLPKYMWRKSSADIAILGQTWSLPVAFKLTGDPDPFLVFGAGYDPGEDSSPVANNNVGRGIVVLNARNGDVRPSGIITSIQGVGPVPSPIASDMAFLAKVTAAGTFGDVYRGYVGDLNGTVYRLDIPDSNVANWKLWKFASLGTGLKFLFAPDVVKAGNRDLVLIGSGDREKPLITTSTDRFFGLADFQNATTVSPGITALLLSDLTELTSLTGLDPLCTTCKGWYRTLAPGEKVVNSPLTVAGTTYFSTNQPVPTPPASCETNLGLAQAYGLSFLTGAAPVGHSSISTVLTGGGLAPSPVGGVVEIEPGKLVSFVIGSGKDGSRLEPERPPLNVPSTRTKIYWNVKTD